MSATFTSGWTGASRIEVCDAPRRLVVSSERDGTTLEAILTAEENGTRLLIDLACNFTPPS